MNKLVLFSLLLLAGCAGGGIERSVNIEAIGAIRVGESALVRGVAFGLDPAGASWSVDNADRLKLEPISGDSLTVKVTGLEPGAAFITVELDGWEDSETIQVEE
ncbi:MAG: hypothetical protein HY548_06940 [Elusimicrobia bacterium]|nr:hypothetical protein [Elusimicrobiota bacterium]